MKLTSYVTHPFSNKHTWTFPCLGILKNDKTVVVLFYSSTSGVVLSSENISFQIGGHSGSWNLDKFEPFYGSVTISGIYGAVGAVGHV